MSKAFMQNGGGVDAATMVGHEPFAVIADAFASATLQFKRWFEQFPQPLRDVAMIETIVVLLTMIALAV